MTKKKDIPKFIDPKAEVKAKGSNARYKEAVKINLLDQQKKIKVRTANIEDYEQVVGLSKLCFPKMPPWTRGQFKSMIDTFKEGQILIDINGKIVASSSSLILEFDEYNDTHNWREITNRGYITNHNPEGDTLYGIEMMVDPEYRNMKLSRRLYEARKKLVVDQNLKRIAIGGRIPGYAKHAPDITADEYVDKVHERAIFDPVLTAQMANGFVLIRLIPDYLPDDLESGGYATYLEWTNIHYSPKKKKPSYDPYMRVCTVQYQLRQIKHFEDFATNVEYFVDVASDYRSDFVVFPEMFTNQLLSFLPQKGPGTTIRMLSEFTQQYLDLFSGLAVKYNTNIIGGSHIMLEGADLFNISFLFKRDGTVGKQYKIHITPHERKWWGVKPGNKVEVFDTDKGKVAILICYDIEFPELARIARKKGANVIFVPFCTDERRAYLRVKYCSQARCIENQVYVVTSGCVGNLPFVENMDVHYAESAIFTPNDFHFARDGIAAECNANIETMIFQDLDLNNLQKHRESGSVQPWTDRRKDMYTLKYTEDDQEIDI